MNSFDMTLAIDIGNSNVVIGFHDGDHWMVHRLPTQLDESPMVFYAVKLSEISLELGISNEQVNKVIISSVVPPLTSVLLDTTKMLFKKDPILMGPSVYPNLKILIRNPYEIGSDLVANAVAAHHFYGKDSVIIDFGTALTFTVVTSKGEILGVAIAPGLKTAMHALFHKTAQLPPEVPLIVPDSPVGKDTPHAIQSGVLIGYEGLVSHIVQQIRKEVGSHFITIATGGLSGILDNLKPTYTYFHPNLTLDGLRIIASTHMA